MLRAIGGTIGGIVVAVLLTLLIERIGHIFYPLPADVDLRDPAQMGGAVDSAPPGAKLFLLAAWLAGGFGGAFVAGLISRAYWAGWAVAGVMALLAFLLLFYLPLSAPMQIALVAAPLLGGIFAHHVGPGRAAAAGPE